MKKWKLVFSVALMAGVVISFSHFAIAKNEPAPGSIIKGKGLSTLYHLGEDGQRYVFPNDKTFFSWFDNFTGIQEIDMEDLQDYPLGGNVRYKPGALLVKIQTDPKVYAVGKNGMLRWVKTEQLARKLYGANWNMLIDDIPDAFFVNYKKGDAIENEDDFSPDDEEDETSAINYNLGLKQRAKIAQKAQTQIEKRCGLLEKSIKKLQKRINRWNIDIQEIGEDYVNECLTSEVNYKGCKKGKDKVTICHIPGGNPDNAHTITISESAVQAHLAQGSYTAGSCEEMDTTTATDTTPPAVPANIIIQDLSSGDEPKLFIAWSVVADPGDWQKYNIWRSTDGFEYGDFPHQTITDRTTNYLLDISELNAETTYYYKVTTQDTNNNISGFSDVVSDKPDEQEADETPPVITNISSPNITTQSAVITWDTDEPSDSTVEYIIVTDGDFTGAPSVKVTTMSDKVSGLGQHSVTITGLSPDTTYYYQVKSADADNNQTTSDEKTFETLPDTTAPELTSIAVNDITTTSATITWTTDEASTGKVTYTTSTESIMFNKFDENENTINHSVDLTDLKALTEYHYWVVSKDAAGNTATSTESTFETSD